MLTIKIKMGDGYLKENNSNAWKNHDLYRFNGVGHLVLITDYPYPCLLGKNIFYLALGRFQMTWAFRHKYLGKLGRMIAVAKIKY